MKLKAVLFDLDNTLYNYDVLHEISLKASFETFKEEFDLSFEDYKNLYEISRSEVHIELSGTASSHNRVLYFKRLIEKVLPSFDPFLIMKLNDAYWETFLDHMTLKKDAKEVLDFLKKENIKIAIISDLTTEIQLRKIEKLGISEYIDLLVTSEETGVDKPHAIMFLKALHGLKINSSEALMVGDSVKNDIVGANSLGIKSVLVNTKEFRKEYLCYHKPDYAINEFSELIPIIENGLKNDF